MSIAPFDCTMQIAIELEQRGKMFYTSFAAVCDNSRIAALAASLANAEEQHLSVFRRMRESQPLLNRCRQFVEEELSAAASELYNTVFPDAGSVRLAAADPDLHKALDMAMAVETQSAAFFTQMAADWGGLDTGILLRLAEEERMHFNILKDHHKRFASFNGEGNHQPYQLTTTRLHV